MLTFFVLKFPKCFQVVTGAGPRIVLSGRYAEEIRNEPNLDFRMSNSIVSAPHAYTESEYYTVECTSNLIYTYSGYSGVLRGLPWIRAVQPRRGASGYRRNGQRQTDAVFK